MSFFGGYCGFPLEFGGGDDVAEIEHEAILDALSPGWDPDDALNSAEMFGYAVALTIAWQINRRLENQAHPRRMLENLRTWEEVLKLRPTPETPDVERRNRVAAKLRAVGNNTIGDINDACVDAFGANFEQLVASDPASVITYWPGVNPGPPGLEWASTRVRVGVQVNLDGLSNQQFEEKRAALAEILDAMLPAWMTFQIGAGDSFVVNVGIVGLTFL